MNISYINMWNEHISHYIILVEILNHLNPDCQIANFKNTKHTILCAPRSVHWSHIHIQQYSYSAIYNGTSA